MSGIAPVGIQGIAPVEHGPRTSKTDLGDAFAQALSDARGLEKDATGQAERFAQGDPSVGIHEVVIASEKANIAVRYATTLKNKALDAYRELMNTQV
ncbi:MAG: flagellar hook-basal body complex protein FliE [Deltaproteobacteria bacterium]|nr:flagellar hook-basal body complex protein FliE [Deltaproteobacteria bacterium]MCW5806001.1 flagellar hook-basal body complex protein FliE [Deltaproteobacteria bacterium]